MVIEFVLAKYPSSYAYRLASLKPPNIFIAKMNVNIDFSFTIPFIEKLT